MLKTGNVPVRYLTFDPKNITLKSNLSDKIFLNKIKEMYIGIIEGKLCARQ